MAGHTNNVTDLTFNPAGDRLVSASFDGTINIWHWRSRQEALSLRGHHGVVTRVRFDADGHRLLSCGVDGTVRLWDGTPRPIDTIHPTSDSSDPKGTP